MTKKRVVVLTGSEIRYEYFYKYLLKQDTFDVVGICCEGLEKSLQRTVSEILKELYVRETTLKCEKTVGARLFSLLYQMSNVSAFGTDLTI